MFPKTLAAAALLVPAVALADAASAGSAYQGGPKSTVSTGAPSQTFETKKPFAQYVPGATVRSKHIYQGGPQSTIPHRQQ